mmetsp:Transcript_35892/g.85944  ORF Transcript_35892/g.85944 Transcript_35892/m.85944 type:complete len:290 (+) Transcript_35892:626-1495(+)
MLWRLEGCTGRRSRAFAASAAAGEELLQCYRGVDGVGCWGLGSSDGGQSCGSQEAGDAARAEASGGGSDPPHRDRPRSRALLHLAGVALCRGAAARCLPAALQGCGGRGSAGGGPPSPCLQRLGELLQGAARRASAAAAVCAEDRGRGPSGRPSVNLGCLASMHGHEASQAEGGAAHVWADALAAGEGPRPLPAALEHGRREAQVPEAAGRGAEPPKGQRQGPVGNTVAGGAEQAAAGWSLLPLVAAGGRLEREAAGQGKVLVAGGLLQLAAAGLLAPRLARCRPGDAP